MKFKKFMALFVTMAMLLTLMPAASVAAAGNVSLDKTDYLCNDLMKVTVTGLSDSQINEQSAWVGMFMKGDKQDASTYDGKYEYVSNFSDGNTWSVKVPTKLGDYEIRLYMKIDGTDSNVESIPFKVVNSTAKPGDVKINKERFLVNDKAVVTITGLTQGQIDNSAWAGIYLTTDAFKTGCYNGMYEYVANLRDGKTWEFTVPSEFDKYEVRIFTSNPNEEERESVLFARLPFVVGSNVAKPGDLKINKEAFKMGEEIKFTITGLTPGQIDDSAWAGLFLPSDEFKTDCYDGIYEYVENLRDGKTWTFKAPTTPGTYEIRVFTKNVADEKREAALFGRVPFKVLNANEVVIDKGAFKWANYKLQVTPNKTVTIVKGKTVKLKVMALKTGAAPVPANILVKYTTGNKSIATVDSTGVIKGVAKGKTTVTVTAGTQKAVITVTVK